MTKRTQTWLQGPAARRMMLALAFLFLSALQPGMFAGANAQGLHAGTGISAGISFAEHDKHAQHHGAVAEEPGQDVREANRHDHSDYRFAEKGCEVHCAPVTTVPVECQASQRPVARCFGPVLVSVLADGEYAEFIRPPRDLN